jgi:AcrR family transcriptional regulator
MATGTREDAVLAAVHLFTEVGYHATTLESVAEAARMSCGALREYYPSPADILRELACECGADIIRHAGRLGPVEADEYGLEELRIWIAGLSSVVHRRSTTMRLWPVVDDPGQGPDRPFLRPLYTFADTLSPRLAKFDTGGVPPQALAIAVLTFAIWAQMTRAAQTPAIGESYVDDHLAVMLGNTLLPDLPRPTWQRPPLPAPPDEITPRRRSRQGPPALPEPPTLPEPPAGLVGLRRPVRTARARLVVERILAAAAEVIRRQGYSGATIPDVVAAAGTSRSSFSSYWADLHALWQTLAHQACLALREPLERLPTADTGRADLHTWIDRWLDVIERHGPVLHVWVHESGNDIELGALTGHLRATTLAIVDGLLPADLPEESMERRVARVVMWALLIELPYALCVRAELVSRADVAALLALFLERAVPDRP